MLAGRPSSSSVPAPASLPHRQCPADQRGAFPARRAGRSVLQTLDCEHRRIDPAIVAHAQSELRVVADVDLDPSSMRVPEGIPKGFRRNSIDLITNDRVQIARLALDFNTECGRALGAAWIASPSPGPDRDRDIVAFVGWTSASPAPRRDLR